jgi:hypothetical protein
LYKDAEWEKKLLKELGFEEPKHHYRHIRYNLIIIIESCLNLMELDKKHLKKDNLEMAERFLQIHDKYVTLLKEFPDFCRIEFTKDCGYFPDISDAGVSNDFPGCAGNYVVESEKRLRKLPE